jgi:hypothetical protein
MRISGAHAIIYSTNPDLDRDFLRDVLKFPSVDVGGGWLIFALPPAEVAVHPSEKNNVHELYLMCDDVEALVAALKKQSVPCSAVREERWGRVVQVTLPAGGTLGMYQPAHARPQAVPTSQSPVRPAPRPPRKPARATSRTKRATKRRPGRTRRP